MLFDEAYYEKDVFSFREAFKKTFGDDIIELSHEMNPDYYVSFKTVFRYLPLMYQIEVNAEFRTFGIMIRDAEGASNGLHLIKPVENVLNKKNIINSVAVLQDVLKQNNFNLYLSVNDKIYRKNADGIKRVKDIRDIRNG